MPDRRTLIENSAGNDLVLPAWNTRGLLASVTRLSSAHDQEYTYDTAGRLSGLEFEGGQSSSAVAWTLTQRRLASPHSHARQRRLRRGPFANVTRSYAVNGLNQYVEVSSTDHCSDANGNPRLRGDRL